MAEPLEQEDLEISAIRYGYQRFQVDIMCYAIIILLLIVQLTQGIEISSSIGERKN